MPRPQIYTSFNKITDFLLKRKPLDSILDTLVKAACSFFNASACAIILYDKDKKNLSIECSYNLSNDFLNLVKAGKKEVIVNQTGTDNKPKFISDLIKLFQDLGDEFTTEMIRNEGIISSVSISLPVKDEPIGYINIYYRNRKDSFDDASTLQYFANLTALSIQHARLVHATKKQTEMIEVFEDVGIRVTSSFNINEIIMLFLPTAVSIVEADAGGFLLIDESIHKVVDAYEYTKGQDTAIRYTSTARLTEGLTGEIVKIRKPVVIPNLKTYENVNPTALAKKRAAVAGFPLIAREKMIGILFVDFFSPREFTTTEIDSLTILCSQAGVALDNTLLYKKISREAKESSFLYELSQSIISTLEPTQLFNNILERLKKTFNFLNLIILLVDEEKKELYPHAYLGYPETIKELRLKVGKQGISGQVAVTKKMYYSPDVRRDPNYYHAYDGEERSEICFPLIIGSNLFGVLDITSPEIDGFTKEDINLLAGVSALISIALENARLYQEAKKLSLTDPLTLLPNRRAFDMFVENEIKRAERYRRPFSILMIDLDNFKNYNDQFGHLLGDNILKEFAQIMKENMRDVDFLGRFGGDEFIAILSETDANHAVQIAKRMSIKIATQGSKWNITLSIGIASSPKDAQDKEKLVFLADQACYQAKLTGGNCIFLAAASNQGKKQ